MSTRTRLLISLVVIVLSAATVWQMDPKLGLDLKGGSQIILDLSARGDKSLNTDVAQRTVEVLRQRVNSLGVSESKLNISGNNRIIVDLPGVTDTERAKEVIGRTAQLTIHPVLSEAAPAGAAINPATSAPTPAPAANPAASTAPSTAAPTGPPTTASGLGLPNQQRGVLGQEAATTTPESSTPPPTTPTDAPPAQDPTGPITASDNSGRSYNLGPAIIMGDGIKTAESVPPGPSKSGWSVSVTFKEGAEKAWTKLTAEQACKPETDVSRMSAFVLDNKIIEVSGPRVGEVQCGVGIIGATTEITSTSFTMDETRTLALLIKGGALPVDVSIASSRYIGPELGEAAIKASQLALIIGGILTILFLFGYYRMLGLVASVALGVYAIVSFAVLLRIGLTLTLPGVAGFVLAVAMAMDSNILVYERVKEEYANGRSLRQSAQLGFKNALSAIIDSNATTFIAAFVLFFFTVGEVKGFGITLLLGTAVSIFITLVVLRTLVTGLLAMNWAHDRPKTLGMYVGSKFRKRMTETPPPLMKWIPQFLVASLAITILALSGFAFRGMEFGIEFTGGRAVEFATASPVNLETARERIADLGIHSATVQHTGNSQLTADQNTIIRAKTITNEHVAQLKSLMESIGGGTATQVQDTTIGPSFSTELRDKAIKGLIIGILCQLIYVGWRFRWTFGVGAVMAMVHDGILIIGLFAWLGKEFNSIFLAGFLTIIAYSVNDSVVVFDRIREQRRRRAGESFADVVSDACAQTLPRTVNLSLSALFILLALYAFGGDTLSDFSLALIVGVISGVISSITVASPIAVLLERWRPTLSSKQTVAAAKKAQARSERLAAAGASTRGSSRSAAASSDDPYEDVAATDTDADADVKADTNTVPETKPETTGRKSSATTRPAPRPRKKSKKRR